MVGIRQFQGIYDMSNVFLSGLGAAVNVFKYLSQVGIRQFQGIYDMSNVFLFWAGSRR